MKFKNPALLLGAIPFLTGCLSGSLSDSSLPVSSTSSAPSIDYGRCYSAALAEAADFNVFVSGDFTQPSSSCGGRVAVGGNAYFSNVSLGDALTPDATRMDLVVGGNLTFVSGAVLSGRATYLQDLDRTSAASFFGGVSKEDSGIPFADTSAYLQRLSAQIGSLQPNGKADHDHYGARFELSLSGSDSVINIFAITADDLERAHTIKVSAPEGASVVINVQGEAATFAAQKHEFSGVSRQQVLFNFPNAKSIYMTDLAIEGSVLAPGADVTFASGQLSGHLAARSFYGQGQMNEAPFHGCLPYCEGSACQ